MSVVRLLCTLACIDYQIMLISWDTPMRLLSKPIVLWLGLVFLFRLNCSLVIVCLLWLCRNVHCGILILVWLNNWMWVTVSMARMLRMTAVMFIQVKELRYQSLFVHNFWCFSSLLKLYVSFGLLSLRYIIMLLWCTVELV